MNIKILFFTLLFTTTANAGLVFEPYVGYSLFSSEGTSTVSGATGGSASLNGTTDTSSGAGLVTYGARLGMSFAMLYLAADYTAASGELEYDVSSISKDDMEGSSVAAVLGLNPPAIPFRFWVGYIFSDEAELTDQSDNSKTTYKGSGLKAGLGYSLIPYVSFNIEYKMVTYDEITDSDGQTQDLPSSSSVSGVSGATVSQSELDTKSILLSISIPLM
ncbi:MAG: hypothetical protein ACPGJV_10430 [Bacteriovoracaceae bacterium]